MKEWVNQGRMSILHKSQNSIAIDKSITLKYEWLIVDHSLVLESVCNDKNKIWTVSMEAEFDHMCIEKSDRQQLNLLACFKRIVLNERLLSRASLADSKSSHLPQELR